MSEQAYTILLSGPASTAPEARLLLSGAGMFVLEDDSSRGLPPEPDEAFVSVVDRDIDRPLPVIEALGWRPRMTEGPRIFLWSQAAMN